ncbi:MAG: TraB/GumN family protein [Candidatus Kapaibacterium sp.]
MIAFSSHLNQIRAFLLSMTIASTLLINSGGLLAQPDTLEHTLLWRIEGNGLQHSSYLYGTIHTEQAFGFDFGDSVLPALLSCETVASELHIDSVSTQILRLIFQPDSVIDLQVEMGEENYAKLNSQLTEKLGLSADYFRYTDPSFLMLIISNVEVKERKLEDVISSDGWPRREFQKIGEVPRETFLDAWLFQTAKLEGKQVVGLETLAEQIAISDTIPLQERLRRLIDIVEVDLVERESVWNNLVQSYKAENLNALLALFKEEEMAPGLYFKLLTERNQIMADRMVKLMQDGSVFTAIGSAHLAGEGGVIALLRNKGFNVVPVFSEKNNALRTYKRPERELEWYQSGDSEGRVYVQTPIPIIDFPSDKLGHDEVRLKMAFDIATGLQYYVMEVDLSFGAILRGNIVERFKDSWFGGEDEVSFSSFLSSRSRRIREKKVTVDGVEGDDISGVDDEGDLMRARIFQHGDKIYLFRCSGSIGMMKSKDDTRFLQSIRFNPIPEKKWEEVWLRDIGLRIQMPGNPTHDTVEEWRNGYSFRAKTITSWAVDPATGIYYGVERYKIPVEYFPRNDSVLAVDMLYTEISQDEVTDEQVIELPNDPSGWTRFKKQYRLELESGVVVTRRIELQGGYVQSMVIIEPSGASDPEKADLFLNKTTRYEDILPLEDYRRTYPEQNFSVTLISPEVDSSGYDFYSGKKYFESGEWLGRSSSLAMCETYWSYFEVESEDAFFENFHNEVTQYSVDSIISEDVVEFAGLRWHDYTISLGYTNRPNFYYRERAALHGSRLYRLRWFSLDPKPNLQAADTFFTSFQLLSPEPEGNLFTRKVDILLNDLSSSDFTTRSQAIGALSSYNFQAEDQAKIRKALKKSYPDDTDSLSQTIDGLLRGFSLEDEESDLKFLKQLYVELPSYHSSRSEILGLFAQHRSQKSLEILGRLLYEDPPKNPYPYQVLSVFYDDLTDAKYLYPGLLRMVGDEGWRDYVTNFTIRALDSGEITLDDIEPERKYVQSEGIEFLKRFRRPNALFENDEDDYYWFWSADRMITLLGRLPAESEVDRQLERALRDTNMSVKRAAIIGLMRHDRPVAEKWLLKVAADPTERVALWRGLASLGKEESFPEEYHTRLYFAEGLIIPLLNDYDEFPDEFEYVADRKIEWNGVSARGYLFKWRYTWDEGEEPWQIAFAVQPDDPNQVGVDETSVRFDWVNFDPEKIDEHFEHLMEMEWE